MNVPLVVLAAATAMLLAERAWPARAWPSRPGFWLRAGAASTAQAAMVWLAGVTWDGWLGAHRPWSLDALGALGGAAVGYLVITFVYYFWHRARHASPLLWRWLHQLHHSPARLEILTTFYKHPLEMLLNGVLSSAVLYLVVGLGPAASTLAVLATGIAELFYHWNVRTPRWLGYLVQRPESHCVHHERGRHASNYADLPLWDILFGTFDNPGALHAEGERGAAAHGARAIACGFEQPEERRVGAMLAGRVVT